MKPNDVERLYVEHARALFAFLAYRCGDRATAEDLLADTFERALRARRRFDRRRASEKTWLYTIALNAARDAQRRRAAEERALEQLHARADGGDERSPAEAVADRHELARAVAALPDPEREAIALRFGADLTVPQIARVTGLPLTTAEGRVYRGLRKLRAELAPGEGAAAGAASRSPASPKPGLRPAGSHAASR